MTNRTQVPSVTHTRQLDIPSFHLLQSPNPVLWCGMPSVSIRIRRYLLNLPVLLQRFLSPSLTPSLWIGLTAGSTSPDTGFRLTEQPPSGKMSVTSAKGEKRARKGAALAGLRPGKEVTQLPCLFTSPWSELVTCPNTREQAVPSCDSSESREPEVFGQQN